MFNEQITTSEFVLSLSSLKGWGKTKVADYIIRHGYDLEECLNFLELELSPNEVSLFCNNIQKVKEDLRLNNSKHISFIDLFDIRFPHKLCEAEDPVIFLFYVGDINLLSTKCIAIIGTRTPDDSFIQNGKIAAEYYGRKGLTIVSGLAIGCDTVAHEAALNTNGKTIAILPSSLDKIMPIQNIELARAIAKKGGLLVSEYSVSSTMNKFNYPQRDRIQSILSDVALVIQSDDDGGTMIAVRKSLKDGKAVYALKGNNLKLINNYIDPLKEKDLEKLL